MNHQQRTEAIADRIAAAGITTTMEEIARPFAWVEDLFPILRRAGLSDEIVLQVFVSEAEHRGLSAEVESLKPILRSIAQ